MRKIKKHQFIHRDPESQNNKKESSGNVPEKRQYDSLAPVKKDTLRTAITLTVFVLIIIAFYFIQTKTNLLAPVLKLFGL